MQQLTRDSRHAPHVTRRVQFVIPVLCKLLEEHKGEVKTATTQVMMMMMMVMMMMIIAELPLLLSSPPPCASSHIPLPPAAARTSACITRGRTHGPLLCRKAERCGTGACAGIGFRGLGFRVWGFGVWGLGLRDMLRSGVVCDAFAAGAAAGAAPTAGAARRPQLTSPKAV